MENVVQVGTEEGGVAETMLPAAHMDPNEAKYFPLNTEAKNMKEVLYALGGGTGANIGGTGNVTVDMDLVRRMRYQDEAVMLVLLAAYFLTLFLSAVFAYREVLNNSRITYYADPRFFTCAVESASVDDFLMEFNQPPKECLQVTGFVQADTSDPSDMSPGHVIEWQQRYYYVAFSFSLDMTSFVVRHSSMFGQAGCEVDDDGVAVEDHENLRQFLENDSNDMATVEMVKQISWDNWEELATNMKLKIRQSGFAGVISINRTEQEKMLVYKNRQWANFMHCRTLKVLCALSVLGWLFYVPYMLLRCQTLIVRSFHRIDVTIADYWPLIADHLMEFGFQPFPLDLSTPPPAAGPSRMSERFQGQLSSEEQVVYGVETSTGGLSTGEHGVVHLPPLGTNGTTRQQNGGEPPFETSVT